MAMSVWFTRITYMVNPYYNQDDPKSCQLLTYYHTIVLMIGNMIICLSKNVLTYIGVI
jgi:hypothetical protein